MWFVWGQWAGMILMKTWCKLCGGQWRWWCDHRDAVRAKRSVTPQMLHTTFNHYVSYFWSASSWRTFGARTFFDCQLHCVLLLHIIASLCSDAMHIVGPRLICTKLWTLDLSLLTCFNVIYSQCYVEYLMVVQMLGFLLQLTKSNKEFVNMFIFRLYFNYARLFCNISSAGGWADALNFKQF